MNEEFQAHLPSLDHTGGILETSLLATGMTSQEPPNCFALGFDGPAFWGVAKSAAST